MIDLAKLIAVSVPPKDATDWLASAEAGVDYLLNQLRDDETIIYASLRCTLVQGVLALRDKVSPPDHEDLLRAMILSDSTWSISYVTGGGEPDRVYMAPPLDHPGCNTLVGGESLIARRRFQSVDKGKTRTEISQKLTHAELLPVRWTPR